MATGCLRLNSAYFKFLLTSLDSEHIKGRMSINEKGLISNEYNWAYQYCSSEICNKVKLIIYLVI